MDDFSLVQYDCSPEHVKALQSLAIAYNAEANKFSALPFCEQHVTNCADQMVNSGSSAIFLLYHYGEVVGGIWVSFSYAIHTTALMGYENMTYVKPEIRGLSFGTYLARVGCEWLESNGCKVIQFGVNSGIDSTPDNPYKNIGFVPIGRNFVKLVR